MQCLLFEHGICKDDPDKLDDMPIARIFELLKDAADWQRFRKTLRR